MSFSISGVGFILALAKGKLDAIAIKTIGKVDE